LDVVQTLFGVILALVAGFAKHVHGKTEKNADDLAAFKTYVATNHPTNDGINHRFDQVDEKLVKIADKMDEKFDKMSNKIESLLSVRRGDDK